MRMRYRLALAISLIALSSPAFVKPALIAITGATLVDVGNGATTPDAVVLIEGGRIVRR